MSPHSVNNFVTDLVQMAQAVEELPKVKQELELAYHELTMTYEQVRGLQADLQQAKDYAASLEQKVRDAEVAKDQAETMFLEADDKLVHTLDRLNQMGNIIRTVTASLSPPQPEPFVSEVKPIEETVHHFDDGGPYNEPQGQSEPDPIAETATALPQSPVAEPDVASSPSPGPYHGKRYYDHSAYVSYPDWLEGGGTEADYYWRPEPTNLPSF